MEKRVFALLAAFTLLFVFLFSPVPGIADAGGFSGDSDFGGGGGSDWGSSSSDWGSSDWSSSGSSSSYYSSSSDDGEGGGLIGFVVAAIIIVIVLRSVMKSGKKGGSGSGSVAPGATRTVLPMTIAQLKEMDPAFAEEAMKEKIANLYIRMQTCWQNKTWEEMRVSMTDTLFNQFGGQLKNMAAKGWTNYIERIAVLDVSLSGFGQDDKHDIVTAIVYARIVDYTVDDKTGNVVSGSKTAEKFLTYEWTLVRTKGAKSFAQDADMAKNCPNCGAPLDLNATAKCNYCGAVITAAEFDWVISGIKGISQRTNG